MSGFQQALKKLVDDQHYGEAVAQDASQLQNEFKLDAREMLLLMQVWHASGDAKAMSIVKLCHCCTSSKKQ
jgi:hypothetical protein